MRGLTGPTAAGGVVLALLLGACAPPGGSDGDSNGNDADSDGEGQAEEGDGEIVIASAMPLTGPYASDGEEMLEALEMAIEEYNEAGGVLGRQLTLITCDVAALEVDTIQACAERLLGEDPHAIITGYDDSGVNTLAFGQGDMPYLHAVTMLAAIEPVMDDPDTYGNVFQYDPSDIDYGTDAAEQLPRIAEEIGFDLASNQTIAVVSTDYSYNAVGADQFIESMEAEGFETVVDERTPFGVEEWGPVISNIVNAEPGIISFWNLDPADAARFMNQLDRAIQDEGLDTLVYMQYTPSIPEFLELAGSSAEGVLWSTVIGVSDIAVGEEALEDYTQRYIDRWDHDPLSIHAFVVRDAFDIWADAVEEAGCASCFEDVIENIRNTEHAGFAGQFRFTAPEEGQYAQQGDDLIPTIWSQVQDGSNVRVLPASIAEAEVQLPPWLR
jgi:branched-chain amino acid transport system substrate-binding protein